MALTSFPLERRLSSLSRGRSSVSSSKQRKNFATRTHLPVIRAQDDSMDVLNRQSSATSYRSSNVTLINSNAAQVRTHVN